MSTKKTYWHLQSLDRVPNDYDIGTSRLLYHPGRGFEVKTPIVDWFARHAPAQDREDGLRLDDWEAFRDPRETTYSRYTGLQKDKEAFVDGLLRSIDEHCYDRELPPDWIESLDRLLPPLRFPLHGLQMVAAYLGSLAPGGRITVCCALQAADEVRRIQHFARRLCQIREAHPQFGQDSKSQWQGAPQWQALRRLIERLLVTYDWSEAFIALNLAVKPMVDRLVNVEWARVAARAGDVLLAKLLFSLEEDARWQRQWSLALLETAFRQSAGNRRWVGITLDRWQPLVEDAGKDLTALVEAEEAGRVALWETICDDHARLRRDLG